MDDLQMILRVGGFVLVGAIMLVLAICKVAAKETTVEASVAFTDEEERCSSTGGRKIVHVAYFLFPDGQKSPFTVTEAQKRTLIWGAKGKLTYKGCVFRGFEVTELPSGGDQLAESDAAVAANASKQRRWPEL